MSYVDEISQILPLDQLAAQTGADAGQVQQAIGMLLPALVGGMQANVQDPAAAMSLLNALAQHNTGLADGPIDVNAIDVNEGLAIAQHVFGSNTDAVVNQLSGASGAGSSLLKKLLPILAPIVLAYLAKKLGSGDNGAIGDLLSQVLKGAAQGSGGSTSGSSAGGDILGDLLGGLLGGGTR
jgi:hypothetical protein